MSLTPLSDYLVALGLETLGHTDDTLFSHLFGVHRLLLEAGRDEEVCRAGVFHSIYGTETTQGFRLPLERRAELVQLLGARGERLAYLNCAMDRASFDRAVEEGAPPFRFLDRITGAEVELPAEDFGDLCAVHLCDWLEQVARSRRGWGYRRGAYRGMADLAGRRAPAVYDRVFGAEPIAPTP
jgi:hypothetical protein